MNMEPVSFQGGHLRDESLCSQLMSHCKCLCFHHFSFKGNATDRYFCLSRKAYLLILEESSTHLQFIYMNTSHLCSGA
jgi:hypothetical protein